MARRRQSGKSDEKRRSRGAAPAGAWLARILGAGLVAAAFAFSSDLAAFTDLPKRLALQLSALVAAAWWIAHAPTRVRLPAHAWLWVALAATVALGFARGNDVYRALETTMHWGFCVAAGFLALQAFDADDARTSVLRSIGATGAAVSAIGLLQYLGWLAWAPETTPPAATFGNRNWAGQVLVPCLPVLTLLSLGARRSWEAWLWPQVFALCTAFQLKIGSSGAFGASVAAVCVMLAGLAVSPVLRRAAPRRLRMHRAPLALSAVSLCLLALLEPDGFGLGRGVEREIRAAQTLAGAADQAASGPPLRRSSIQKRIDYYPASGRRPGNLAEEGDAVGLGHHVGFAVPGLAVSAVVDHDAERGNRHGHGGREENGLAASGFVHGAVLDDVAGLGVGIGVRDGIGVGFRIVARLGDEAARLLEDLFEGRRRVVGVDRGRVVDEQRLDERVERVGRIAAEGVVDDAHEHVGLGGGVGGQSGLCDQLDGLLELVAGGLELEGVVVVVGVREETLDATSDIGLCMGRGERTKAAREHDEATEDDRAHRVALVSGS